MLSRLFFMAELAVAESLLVYRFRPRRLFLLRLFFSAVVLAGAAALSSLLPNNVFIAIAAYIILFLLTFLAIAFCFKERFFNCVDFMPSLRIRCSIYERVVRAVFACNAV